MEFGSFTKSDVDEYEKRALQNKDSIDVHWVVAENSFHTWKCTRCGDVYCASGLVNQPLWVIPAVMEGYINEHKDCKEVSDGSTNESTP